MANLTRGQDFTQRERRAFERLTIVKDESVKDEKHA